MNYRNVCLVQYDLVGLFFFQNGHRWQIFQDLLGADQDNLDLANVNLMLELLVQKKKQLEAVSLWFFFTISISIFFFALRDFLLCSGNLIKLIHSSCLPL